MCARTKLCRVGVNASRAACLAATAEVPPLVARRVKLRPSGNYGRNRSSATQNRARHLLQCMRPQASARLWVARVDEKAQAVVPGSDAVYRFPSKSYGNVEGIAWLSRDTLVAVSDRKKRQQPARCAEKDQSIHLFRIPAGPLDQT
jgi:hypothetical protein